MNRFRGRRHRIAMLVVTLLALSVWAAVGLAKSGPTQITTKLYYGDVHSVSGGGPCPPDVFSKNSSGWATIKNDKGNWTVVVHMRGAKPGDYHVDLIYPASGDCEQFGDILGHFKVDANGDGDGKVSLTVSGVSTFYVRAHGEGNTYVSPLLQIGG
jgi:hypothetical protein